MNKEEISNKYQELLKEYQDAEVSRRKNIEEVQKIKEQKDIAEQKVEFEEAKERFCTKCGEKVADGAKFCMNCGNEL